MRSLLWGYGKGLLKASPIPGLAGENTLAEAKPPEGREAYPRGTLPRQSFLTPFQSRYDERVAGL